MPNLKKIITSNLPMLIKSSIKRNSPFLSNKIRLNPYLATLTVTDNCCLKCVMCNEWQHPHPNELTTQEWKDVIFQLKTEGIKDVNFTGGEPLMRRDLMELIKYSRSLGFTVGITTNGFLLDNNKLTQLIDAGVSVFSISMDAVGEAYDEIRGVKGAYDRLIGACQLLSQSKQKNSIDVFLCFLLMKNTIDEFSDVERVASELQLPLVINLFDMSPYFFQTDQVKEDFWIDPADEKFKKFLKHIVSKKRADTNYMYHRFAEIDFFKEYFKDPIQKDIPCVVSQSRICISAKGDVYGGCWSLGVHGNTRKNKLKDIMTSDKYKKIHEKMFFKKCQGCSCGYSVNLRYSFKYMMKELIFRLFPKSTNKISS